MHPNVVPHATIYALADPSTPGGMRWTMHVRVFCAVCMMPFKFEGNIPLAPAGLEEAIMARTGVWVSASADEIGVIIAPDDAPGEGLANMTMAGRA